MASNYQQSDGTDLDNVFLVNTSNAGALGFQISSGQDLGNRYSNYTTKLGRAVGFQNSSGTDIGYLRSHTQLTAPVTTGQWCTFNNFKADSTLGYLIVEGYISIGMTASPTGTWEVQIRAYNYGSSKLHEYIHLNSTSTSSSSTNYNREWRVSSNTWGDWKYLVGSDYSYSPSINIGIRIETSSGGTPKLNLEIRQRMYNSAGASAWSTYNWYGEDAYENHQCDCDCD